MLEEVGGEGELLEGLLSLVDGLGVEAGVEDLQERGVVHGVEVAARFVS